MVNLVAASVDSLEVRKHFPFAFEIHSDIRIPLSDGHWLHARAWMPVDAIKNPVPAIVEYAPFRHRDFTAPRDALIHPWFAGHGYASIRIELRGSGDSSGLPNDEYVLQEQTDALEALEWISNQPWCSGNTGLFGMSWGAFSALQIAAHNPPSLKAIIPVHGTDDRFADDIHYKGGALLGAGLSWGTLYTLYMMRSPDPELSGESWRDTWLQRFDECPLVLKEWMSHQYKDDYWKHGSVNEDYSSVKCPALVVCGWADGYTNAAMRMAQHLSAESQVIVGPWAHTYPHLAQPGPQIGFLQEAVNWWDRWLKNIDNSVDPQPRLRLWLQGSVPPSSSYSYRDGKWLSLDSWPSSSVKSWRLFLTPDGLSETADSTETIQSIQSSITNAYHGQEWLPHGVGQEMPIDQNEEDSGSLCFESEPLTEDINICGAPALTLCLSSNFASGIVNVRLNDIAADNQSTQISYAVLNLNHRDGLDKPEAVEPDQVYTLDIKLNEIAQNIPKGHRLRLAISTQAWPLVWPSVDHSTFQVNLSQCSFNLPMISNQVVKSTCPLELPVAAIPEALPLEWLREVNRERAIHYDAESDTTHRSYLKDDGCFRIKEHGMEVDAYGTLTYRSVGEDPLSAEAQFSYRIRQARADWNTTVECNVSTTCDAENLYLTGEYRAIESGKTIKTRIIDQVIKRRYI